MKWFILILGVWATLEAGVTLAFPGFTKSVARRLFGQAGQWIADQSNLALRKIALLEGLFGVWMLVLWAFTR